MLVRVRAVPRQSLCCPPPGKALIIVPLISWGGAPCVRGCYPSPSVLKEDP